MKNISNCLFGLIPIIIGIILLFCIKYCDSGDDFGKEHPISSNAIYDIPIKNNGSFIDPTESDSSSWFQLREGEGNPGIYEVALSYPVLEDGYITVHCYEDSENIPLTTEMNRNVDSALEELPSQIKVHGHSSFGSILNAEMTIFEGDWGDYYVARIEVWFCSSKTNKKRLLMKKNFKVCGWQR